MCSVNMATDSVCGVRGDDGDAGARSDQLSSVQLYKYYDISSPGVSGFRVPFEDYVYGSCE